MSQELETCYMCQQPIQDWQDADLEVVIGLDANGDYEYAPCHMDCVNPLLDEEECDGWD